MQFCSIEEVGNIVVFTVQYVTLHFIITPKCLIQLLGQAARNMVIQEDAILHSEDVSKENSLIYVRLSYRCVSQGVRNQH